MKYILIILLLFLSCSSNNQIIEVDTIYSLNNIELAGLKIKGDLETEFEEATDSKWGFVKGREVAVIRYETAEIARDLGEISGKEQTEFIAIVEKNIAHGPKVEKTKCRGFKSNRYGFNNKMNINSDNEIGFGNILILNKLKIFEDEIYSGNEESVGKPCVRREPLYSDFVIHGNLVILAEPLMKDYGQGQMIESSEKTIKFINEIINNLP
ncbi:MAG: hypothetical protein CL907_01200 [Dehalococcoidia bacterium]|nr:hypothetical protein [Dehalococcoidia bacterium]|tara:strand:- start:220 stop:852 length:633 start_codon:yes stop_codon:yes gene_type:complete